DVGGQEGRLSFDEEDADGKPYEDAREGVELDMAIPPSRMMSWSRSGAISNKQIPKNRSLTRGKDNAKDSQMSAQQAVKAIEATICVEDQS
ncbi:hypothetical protein E4U34_000810, partial [Claviceps purpurea]